MSLHPTTAGKLIEIVCRTHTFVEIGTIQTGTKVTLCHSRQCKRAKGYNRNNLFHSYHLIYSSFLISSSLNDNVSHFSTYSSRAFFVDVYSVMSFMSEAFSGLQRISSSSLSRASIFSILFSDSFTAFSALDTFFILSLRSA